MPPPDNENGPQSTTSETRPNDLMAANSSPKVQRRPRRRHVLGQTSLPIVEGLLFIGGPGRKTADIEVPNCEWCGRDHRHTCPLPAPALTPTKHADCGASYQVMPKRFRATKRRRAA